MLFHGWNCYPQCHTPSSHSWHTWSPHFRSPENLLLVSNLRCFPTFSLEAPESCTRAHLSSPTFKQAYAHSLFLRRASDSYPLSLTLCLTQTDLPPRPHSSGQAETEARWSLSLALSRQHKNYRLSRGRLREVRRCCNGADFHAARENSSHTRDGSQPWGGGGCWQPELSIPGCFLRSLPIPGQLHFGRRLPASPQSPCPSRLSVAEARARGNSVRPEPK